jgi:hypothetical protein
VTYLVLACQGLLTAVLLVSATSKLRSGRALRAFAASLTSLRLVRGGHAGPVAAAITVLEVVAAALLAVPPTRAVGFAASATLLAVLTAGVAVVLGRGTAAPCRCFGASSTPLARRHLVRNVLLTAAALVGLAAPAGQRPLLGSLVALLAGASTGLLVTVLDDLVALFTPTQFSEENRWPT